MVWFFSRSSELAQCEVRQPRAGRFELIVTQSIGADAMDQTVERFDAPRDLVERCLSRQEELMRDGWTPEPVRVFAQIFTQDALA